jgi:hypothetical protein
MEFFDKMFGLSEEDPRRKDDEHEREEEECESNEEEDIMWHAITSLQGQVEGKPATSLWQFIKCKPLR